MAVESVLNLLKDVVLMKAEKPLFSPDTFQYQSLLETIAQETQFLWIMIYLTRRPLDQKVDENEKVIFPHFYEYPLEQPPAINLGKRFSSYRAGPACQALGDPQAAWAWQHANRAGWQAGVNSSRFHPLLFTFAQEGILPGGHQIARIVSS